MTLCPPGRSMAAASLQLPPLWATSPIRADAHPLRTHLVGWRPFWDGPLAPSIMHIPWFCFCPQGWGRDLRDRAGRLL